MTDKSEFLHPISKYQGEFKPETLVFNANLQEFAQKVGYVCALETGGKINSNQAYQQIRELWRELKKSKKELGIGAPPDQQE
ncbi:hypothetical protein Pse7367_0039 [Thalassoporum mexicanum PCC 7367]|uniref:DUF7219 family protein n=1 Tax=Thalassoporum mexicanum TaxID=3457544 RepID=UPI00029FFDC1|nr:hypothetical protein [Pseudanabaena sp. PCC 7367]AFY68359.1 hypothetical protein Pse7367_0039 [Pseudanabaena sp. PCC 7367]